MHHLLQAFRFTLGMLGVFASAHAATELRTAAHEGTEPKFVATAGPGSAPVTGVCVKLFRAIEKLEPDLKFVGDQHWMPMARQEAEIVAQGHDVACGLIKTEERQAKFVYLEPGMMTVNYVLVARADDNIQINGWDDVRKLGKNGVVLVTAGHGPANYLKGIGGLHVDAGGKSAEFNLQKLVAGRGRFLYHRSPGIETEIEKAGLTGKVRILPRAMLSTKLYLVVGKHVSAEKIDKVQRALSKLEKSGQLHRFSNVGGED